MSKKQLAIHKDKKGLTVCGAGRGDNRRYTSKPLLTKTWAQVTCKNCLKLRTD